MVHDAVEAVAYVQADAALVAAPTFGSAVISHLHVECVARTSNQPKSDAT